MRLWAMWRVFIAVFLLLFHVATCTEAGISTRDSTGRRLIYLQIITTPGEFAPLKLYPTDENTKDDWTYGLEQPTKLGKLQAYQLGKILRQRYSGFITAKLPEFDLYSAGAERCTIAALSLAASLFAPSQDTRFEPGLNWQPVPVVHKLYYDRFLNLDDFCTALVRERDEMLLSKHFLNITQNDKKFYSYLSNMSGIRIKNMFGVASLFDTLAKERAAHLIVPSWATAYWDDMKRITDQSYGWKYNFTSGRILKIGSLVDLLVSRMKVKKQGVDTTSDIRVSLYMTHDWIMAALLQTIGHFNGLQPVPATTLLLEFHRLADQFEVRMLMFNSTYPELGSQKPHVISLDGCGEYCPLDRYSDFFTPIIPTQFTKQCGLFRRLKSGESKRVKD